ncbi:MAG: hypothetical protein AAF821_21880 [Cyanobacteria bacterium P01_D01_bin.156]
MTHRSNTIQLLILNYLDWGAAPRQDGLNFQSLYPKKPDESFHSLNQQRLD